MGCFLKKFGAPMLTVLLLAGVAANNLRVDPAEAEPFHARAAKAIAAAPKTFGDWIFVRDIPQPTDAEEMLKPNGYLDRLYLNSRTGHYVEVLLDQCKDSRDMEGHYPRVCYPSSACNIDLAVLRTWSVDKLEIPGCEYTVRRPNGTIMIIRDFFILPDGRMCGDMTDVNASAKDFRQTVYGVAQMQVLFFDASVGEAQRDSEFATIVRGYRPVIDTLLNGLVDRNASH
jgi:hypothetical protein